MQDLDKYFREKLENRQFELQDAYWQQAQELLAADERRRRRVGWFWWGGGAALLLLLGAVVFFLSGNDATAPRSAVAGGGLPSANAPTAEQSSATDDATASTEILPENTENEDVANENSAATKVPAAFAEGKKSMAERTGGDLPKAKKQANVTRGGASQTNAEDGMKPPFAGAAEQTDLAIADPAGAPVPATASEPGLPANTPAEEASTARIEAPERLDALTIFVEGDFEEQLQPADSEYFAKRNPWSLAVEVGQIFQPTPRSSEQTGIGQQAGLLLRYDLSEENDFYLATGLRYQRRTGTFDFTKFNENRTYRFGLELDTALLQPQSLHYLSVPVLVGRQRGRHVLEAGLSLDRLLGIRGEIGSIQRTGEPPRRIFQAIDSGWLVEDGYKKWTATTQLNYRFRVSQQWSFGLSANYTLGGILAPVESEVFEGRALLREDDKFYLGLQAVFAL